MAFIVQKYGGTSLGSTQRIKNVAARIARFKAQRHDVLVVASAMEGETNRLIALAHAIQADPDPREFDVLIASGEQVSIGLLAMAVKSEGCEAKSYLGSQVRIVTDSAFGKARIQTIDHAAIRADLRAGRVVIVAGFQGVDADGNITTLGRGGSDTTGVALAAALNADECQIYTDVDGIYTTDPRLVADARRLDCITFEEMLEMASLGSKVLQPRSVELASKYNVRLRVLSSFQEHSAGTLITAQQDPPAMENPIISGIAFSRNEARINVIGVPNQPGVAYQIVGPIAQANIDVDMIIQNVGQAHTDFSFTLPKTDLATALQTLEEKKIKIGAAKICGDDKICKVSIVGVGMRSHVGVAATMFKTLAEAGINIQIISTSEIKISVVIDEKYLELAVRILHKAFCLSDPAR